MKENPLHRTQNTREESDKEDFSDKEKDPLDVQWNRIDKFALVAFSITYFMFLMFYFYHYYKLL